MGADPMGSISSRRLVLALGLLVGLLSAAACGRDDTLRQPTTATEAPRRGGTVVIGTITDLQTVNEAIASPSIFNRWIIDRMFVRLLEEQPDFKEHPPTFAPRLAESFEWSEDHLRLTFHLREDAHWSDGTPVTAEDVRWTWEAHTHPQVASVIAAQKRSISEVEIVDPHTVRFHFSRVYSAQLLDANEGVILPKHAWQELPFSQWRARPEWFREHLVVTGPFVLESWHPQQEIVLARNDGYFEADLPYLDRMVFRVIPDRVNQITQLGNGTLHLVEQVPPHEAELLRASPNVELIPFWPSYYFFVCWNTASPLFSEASVRRALTLAIDRQAIIETLWGDHARAAVSPIVTDVWAHNRTLEPWPYDPRQAHQILESQGWTDRNGDGVVDRNGQSFSFQLDTNEGNQTRVDAIIMIQDQLSRVGIEVRPKVLDFNTQSSLLESHTFEATLMGFSMDTSLDLGYAFHSDSIDGDANFSGYSNPEADRLIEEIRKVSDLARAKPLLDRLQAIIHHDQPFTFLWEPQLVLGISRRLHNVRPTMIDVFFGAREWWLEPSH
jgi:peptide/nickel transport system substrate-binding protein